MRYQRTLRSSACVRAQHGVCARYVLDQRHELRPCSCHCHAAANRWAADVRVRRDRWNADLQVLERIESQRLELAAR